ncbi:MAG: hypothetical protein Q9208_007926 [Pyrenodesmia sp. 3 TL-2023]
MEVDSVLRTGDEAVEFTVSVDTERSILKVFKPDAAATAIAVYRHLQSVYLEGLLVPKLIGIDDLSESDRSTLCEYLERQPPHDWSQEDWEDWGMSQYKSFVQDGQAIRLECIKGTTLADYRDQEMPPHLERSLLEGLITLHGAGLLLGSIEEESIVILNEGHPSNDNCPVVIFTDLSHARVQRPADIESVMQRWREVSQLRSRIWDIKFTKDSNTGREMLRTFVENHQAEVKTLDMGSLVEACRLIQNRPLVCISWFEDEENQKLIASLELSQVVYVLRALALGPAGVTYGQSGRVLGQLLLNRIPVEALRRHRLLHYQWLISALLCDRHHLDSAWWRETGELLMTAFDNIIALHKLSGDLLASFEAKSLKAGARRRFGKQEESIQMFQETLADFKDHGFPWYHEQVMMTIYNIFHHFSYTQSNALNRNGYIEDIASYDVHIIHHDLPRRDNSTTLNLNPRNLGWRVQSMFPLPPNETETKVPGATPPNGQSQILSPPQSNETAVPRDLKRARDDELEDEHLARSSSIKRTRTDNSPGAASPILGLTGYERYQSYAKVMKEAIRVRYELAREDQAELQGAANGKPTFPPDGVSNGPRPSWLAGIDKLQKPPETDCKDLEIIGKAVKYESCLCLPVKLRKRSYEADEDCELIIYRQRNDKMCETNELAPQEPDWYKDSIFHSAQFAQMQLQHRRSVIPAWERKCVGQVQVTDEFLQAMSGDTFDGGSKGQAPLRGLLFHWTDRDRFSQRLHELLAGHSPKFISSDALETMLDALIECLHGSGICRLYLDLGNIRLVRAGSFSPGTGTVPFETRIWNRLSPNNSHPTGPSRVLALELVNLAGSARWCPKGVQDDQQRLQELKRKIREKW